MDVQRVSPDSPRHVLEAAISAMRRQAERLSRHDPRRDEIDVVVDEMVEWWLAAEERSHGRLPVPHSPR